MGRKKTYTAASVSNLNTEDEEVRYAQIKVLQAVLRGESAASVYTIGVDGLRGDTGWMQTAAGVKHRNYIIWAKEKPYSDYDREDLYGDTGESTYDDLINMVSPSTSAEVGFTEDQIKQILSERFDISLDTETLENQTISVDAVTSDGTYTKVNITTDITRRWYYKCDVSYIGRYDLQTLATAYIYENGDTYKSGWFGYGLITGDDYVSITSGDSATDVDYDEDLDEIESVLNPDYEVTEGEEVSLEGDALDAWFFWGYNTTEEHVDEDTEETVIETVFNEEEQEYVYLDSWLQTKTGDYDTSDTVFYVLAGYVYCVDTIDAYETQDGIILLNANGTPTQVADETMVLYYRYSWEFEDYQSTYTKSQNSRINLDNVKFFSIVMNNEDAMEDELLGGTTEDVETVDLMFSPPIAFMNDKTWYNEDDQPTWYYRVWRACTQAMGDDDSYDDLYDSLKESLTDSKIAYVYLMFGLPTNMCQLNYCARYAIQFFKMLTVSNWRNISRGQEYSTSCGSKSYTISASKFNYYFQFKFSYCAYRSGSGVCPVTGDTTIKAGSGGVATYNNYTTIWRQINDDAWEYVQVSGYETIFSNIKNGKSKTVATDGWFDDIWETEGVERNYSNNLLPVSKEIFAEISFADFTDCLQYCYNIGVTAYKVVKKKWYQTGLFKVLLYVIVLIITVIAYCYTGYGGAAVSAASGGILATAYAILINLIISVAVSIVVGYVLQILIAPILTAVFGEVIGQIFTAIIQIYISIKIGIAMGNIGAEAGTLTAQLTNPLNWLTAINAGINGYSQSLTERVNKYSSKLETLQENYEDAMDEINSAIAENLGDSGILKYLDLYNRLDASEFETASEYITRVFMSGSDIAETILYVQDNFADVFIDNMKTPRLLS